MKKYHVHTTLSQKHMELLKRLSEKYDTQQKVLELALESLVNESKNTPPMTPEMEFWMRIGSDVKTACLIQKDGLKELMRTADVDQYSVFVKDQKPLEYSLEYYTQKSAKDCNLKEVIDGLIINAKLCNWFEMIDSSDEGDHYTIKFFHNLGLNNSKISQIMCESVFSTYGYKTESDISDRYLFVKIFKNS
jgi:hypothetical protein